MSERLQAAEERAKSARRAAMNAQTKVNGLKREAMKTERRKRAHLLIAMGAQLQSVGLRDAAEVGHLLALLKPWTFTDKESGERLGIFDDCLLKIVEKREK